MAKTYKEKLFDRGAQALSLTYELEDTYLCPLCGNDFSKESLKTGELTLEHVPPKSQGGKGIILTCNKCNSKAGQVIDAQAANREKLNEFTHGFLNKEEGYVGRAMLEIGGYQLDIAISKIDGGYNMHVPKGTNDPNIIKEVQDYLFELSSKNQWNGSEFKVLSSVNYDKHLAEVSDLRTAYLISFAALGYRYAFSSALKKVRMQISKPSEKILMPWLFTIKEPTPRYVIGIDDKLGVALVILGIKVVVLTMARPKKSGGKRDKHLTMHLTPSEYEQLELFSETSGLDKTKIIFRQWFSSFKIVLVSRVFSTTSSSISM